MQIMRHVDTDRAEQLPGRVAGSGRTRRRLAWEKHRQGILPEERKEIKRMRPYTYKALNIHDPTHLRLYTSKSYVSRTRHIQKLQILKSTHFESYTSKIVHILHSTRSGTYTFTILHIQNPITFTIYTSNIFSYASLHIKHPTYPLIYTLTTLHIQKLHIQSPTHSEPVYS